ncbi:MAG: hypothetical protein RBT68_11950 [Spirochaetia bacterium]|nr:hypothetical protein [Spirochaetia bacterium]
MKPGKTTTPAIVSPLFMVLALFCSAQGALAQSAFPALPDDKPLSGIPDSADIRIRLWTSLISARPASVMAMKPKTETNPWGSWRLSMDRGQDAFYLSIIPARQPLPAANTGTSPSPYIAPVPATSGNTPVSYAQYTQGTWIIKRSSSTGDFLQVKIFLRSDPGTFARIYPFGERSRMDIVAYGGVLYREVIVPLSFEDSLRSPLSRIIRLTSDVVDWSLFSPDPALHAETRSLAASIRTWLPGLRYGDDGALDADGRPVYIASLLPQGPLPGLNCSGFVKWIADGILHPLTGSWLSVAAIKERMTDWRGSSFTERFEETHDPFFGLDWSRALAKEAWQVMYPGRNEDSPLAHDVSDPPFALIVNDSSPVNGGSSYRSFTDNFDDAGIEMSGLKATLFMLASREPGRFYLAQFNAQDPQPPSLRRYFHIAALFPYFDTDGIFKVAVFESAEETSLDRILGSRLYEYVKLVRMPASARFEPPLLGPPAEATAAEIQATTGRP